MPRPTPLTTSGTTLTAALYIDQDEQFENFTW
jgi:hypothetical protein